VGREKLHVLRKNPLHKPDGLDVIDHTNVLEVYKRVKLLDLNGINTRFQARLNAYGNLNTTRRLPIRSCHQMEVNVWVVYIFSSLDGEMIPRKMLMLM
jgi:hypothetical protein